MKSGDSPILSRENATETDFSRKANGETRAEIAAAKAIAAFELRYGEERKALRESVARLTQSETRLSRQLAAAERHCEELRAAFDRRTAELSARFLAEIECALGEKTRAESAAAELRAQIAETTAELRRAEATAAAALNALRNDIDFERRKNANLIAEKTDSLSRNNRAIECEREANAELRAENRRIIAELQLFRAEELEIQTFREHSKRESAAANAEIERLIAALSESERRVASLENEIRANAQRQNAEIAREYRAQTVAFQSLSDELANERKANRTLSERIGEMSAKIAASETAAIARRGAERERVAELQREIEERTRQLRAEEKAARESQLETHKLKIELLSARAAENAPPTEIAALKAKNAQLKQKLAFANRRLKELILERRASPKTAERLSPETKTAPKSPRSHAQSDGSAAETQTRARLEELLLEGRAIYEI